MAFLHLCRIENFLDVKDRMMLVTMKRDEKYNNKNIYSHIIKLQELLKE